MWPKKARAIGTSIWSMLVPLAAHKWDIYHKHTLTQLLQSLHSSRLFFALCSFTQNIPHPASSSPPLFPVTHNSLYLLDFRAHLLRHWGPTGLEKLGQPRCSRPAPCFIIEITTRSTVSGAHVAYCSTETPSPTLFLCLSPSFSFSPEIKYLILSLRFWHCCRHHDPSGWLWKAVVINIPTCSWI